MQKINIGTEIDIMDLLTSRLLIQANSGGGKSVLARVIMEEVYNKVPFIVMDIEGEYYTLKEKHGDILVIGGSHADVPISLKSVKLLPKEIIANRLSVVIDMSDMQMNDRIMYSKLFLETMMDLPKEYWVNYLVFLEEAHKLCGEQDKQASATAVKDLMSRGRKRGYCGVLLTQRISKLHKDAAAECNNKFIGRTFLDIDLDRAAKELGLSSSADKNVIRNLQPGHFYAFGTSIHPHQVHTVKVNMPKTKIPKAGVDLNIKPQKPTAKILALLTKLNELPSAETAKKPVVTVNSEKDALEIKCLREERDHLNKLNFQLEQTNAQLKKKVGAISETIKKMSQVLDEPLPSNSLNSERDMGYRQTNIPKPISLSAAQKPVSKPAGDGTLGKCARAIIAFLAGYAERSFTKAQVAIATGYSAGSGGFNNALSELNTKGFILRDGKLQANPDAMEQIEACLGHIEPMVFNISTYRNNLGKCEREIYDVLLQWPKYEFTKEEMGEKTGYSHGSGGFNNALSRLNTLELIVRRSGTIMLNPELLELM